MRGKMRVPARKRGELPSSLSKKRHSACIKQNSGCGGTRILPVNVRSQFGPSKADTSMLSKCPAAWPLLGTASLLTRRGLRQKRKNEKGPASRVIPGRRLETVIASSETTKQSRSQVTEIASGMRRGVSPSRLNGFSGSEQQNRRCKPHSAPVRFSPTNKAAVGRLAKLIAFVRLGTLAFH
jgi:hypothetical protein